MPELKQNENQTDRKKVPCFFRKQVSEMLNDNKERKEKLLSQLGPEAPIWAEEYKLGDQHLESLLNTQEKLYDIVSPLPVFQGFPKTELWRLFMDGKDHEKGILGFENERGYMEGMMKGFIQVVKTLGEKLDHSSYENLHNICTGNVCDKEGELLRSSYFPQEMCFGISNNNWSEEGYQELQKKCDEGHVVGRNLCNPKDRISPSEVQEKMRILKNFKDVKDKEKQIIGIMRSDPYDKRIRELKNEIKAITKDSGVDKVSNSVERNILAIQRKLSNLDQKVKYIRKNMSLIKLKEGVQTIIDDYYNKINTIGKNENEVTEQKLAAAIECCQNLDQLHAFADGNVRTATLVLNKFLIELGEYPCIFDNPNVLDVKSIRELMQYVRKGQEKFKSYKNSMH